VKTARSFVTSGAAAPRCLTESTISRINAGTACRQVSPPRRSTRLSTSSVGRRGKNTAVPPVRSGDSSSNREMSNVGRARQGMQSPAMKSNSFRVAARVAASMPCSTCTALGWPVVPEV